MDWRGESRCSTYRASLLNARCGAQRRSSLLSDTVKKTYPPQSAVHHATSASWHETIVPALTGLEKSLLPSSEITVSRQLASANGVQWWYHKRQISRLAGVIGMSRDTRIKRSLISESSLSLMSVRQLCSRFSIGEHRRALSACK